MSEEGFDACREAAAVEGVVEVIELVEVVEEVSFERGGEKQ